MEISEFCNGISGLSLDQTKIALAILWFYDENSPDIVMSSGQIARIIFETGLGNPHSTQLAERLKKTGLVIQSSRGFRLKVISRSQIRKWLESILGAVRPSVNQELGFLPKDVWIDTRGYIEKVCSQLNGCYQFEFYDAASVMIRRLIETLLIECYEHLNRLNEIRGSDGNFFMLNELIVRATSSTGLTLGRDARRALSEVKEIGDRSAHNRRYNAVKADLDKIQSGIRVASDEMINLASLRRP